jgi:Tol biopolymer transport system component
MISLAATTSVDESKAFVVNVSDGSVRSLSDHGWRSIRAMSWLYDGSGVIVVAVEKGFILPQLWLISYPGGDVHRLTTDLSLYGLTTSALNDDSILSVAGMNQSNIWLASASDLADAKQITFGSPGQNAGWNGVAFTPDGRIVYSSENNEGMTLWIMEADGRGQKQIIPTGGINNYPSVTADGRYVVFQSNRSGHFAVWRADLDGGNMVQLTGDTPAGRPFVSSDGRAIVYTANGDGPGELWKMSIDGSGAARLLDAGADWAQISPDGQMIACEYQNGGSPKLAILPIDGSRQPTLFDVPRLANFRLGVHWSPDGRSVTYRDWADGLWEQSVSGGEPHRIAGLPKEKLFSYAWSADGRMLAFTRGSEVRDVVLIRDSK